MILRNTLVSALCFAAPMVLTPNAQAAYLGDPSGVHSTVSISNNSGGNVAAFAIETASYRSAGTMVKFDGRCDSACTLFLSLPTSQTCVSHGAFFRFHSPTAGSARSERIAQNFMMRKYPGWVRSWIASHNGLSRELITMDYSFASQHMHSCGGIAAR